MEACQKSIFQLVIDVAVYGIFVETGLHLNHVRIMNHEMKLLTEEQL